MTETWEPEPTTGCWLWLGNANPAGYGRTTRGRYAHRQAWLDAGLTIPDGWVLHHRCHQRACVNVGHLELSTRSAHMREHAAAWKTTTEQKKAKRTAYMRVYLPRWRAQRKAASSGGDALLCKSLRYRIARLEGRIRALDAAHRNLT